MKNKRTLIMKTLSICGVLAAGLITCFAGTADASLVAPGTACYPESGAPWDSLVRLGAYTTSEDPTNRITLVCPIAIDHALDSSVDFTILVNDQHAAQSIICSGNVYGISGTSIGAVTGMSTGPSLMGTQTLTGSVSVSPSTDNNYAVICELPPIGVDSSWILSIKVD